MPPLFSCLAWRRGPELCSSGQAVGVEHWHAPTNPWHFIPHADPTISSSRKLKDTAYISRGNARIVNCHMLSLSPLRTCHIFRSCDLPQLPQVALREPTVQLSHVAQLKCTAQLSHFALLETTGRLSHVMLRSLSALRSCHILRCWRRLCDCHMLRIAWVICAAVTCWATWDQRGAVTCCAASDYRLVARCCTAWVFLAAVLNLRIVLAYRVSAECRAANHRRT